MSSIRDPPPMSEPYEGWKNEVHAWSILVVEKIPKTKQGIALFLSLKGDARKAASKVPLSDMQKDEGLNLVLAELDKFFLKDKDRAAFLAYDKFNAFRRPDGMSIKEFLMKFELLLNTCATHGIVIADKIVAHQMLQSANISQGKREIIITTLDTFTADKMRGQILRLFCEEQVPETGPSNQIKVKEEAEEGSSYVMFGSRKSNYQSQNSYQQPHSSYSQPQNNQNQFQSSRGRNKKGNSNRRRNYRNSNKSRPLKKNPVDEFGNTTFCDFCHSVYHYVDDCPDAKRSSYENTHDYNL